MQWEQQRFYGSSSSNSGKKEINPLILFDKKVSEADAYLQLMIEQVAVSRFKKYYNIKINLNFFSGGVSTESRRQS